MKRLILVLCCISLVVMQGCRGWRSEEPPVHLNPNMDFQAKYRAQSLPLELPDNTVPWGNEQSFSDASERVKYVAKESPSTYYKAYFEGKNENGSFLTRIPKEVAVTHALLERGQQRFNIYCAPCHGQDGHGYGTVTTRAWFKPASYSDERVVKHSDGKLFDIITNGINTMPSYKQQIEENDRWAIVAYIRALQKSQNSSVRDVPEDYLRQITE